MLAATDLIHLPYTPDLTEAGIAYASRMLAFSRPGLGKPTYSRLRRTVAVTAVELAFRRHLQQLAVPFRVAGHQPFTDPDHYDLSLNGRRCRLVSYWISRRNQALELRLDASRLLEATALVPSDEFVGEDCHPDDIYIFAFLLGLEAVSRGGPGKSAPGSPAGVLRAPAAAGLVTSVRLEPP